MDRGIVSERNIYGSTTLLKEQYSTARLSYDLVLVEGGTVDKLYYTYYARSLREIVSFVVKMSVFVQSLRIIINNDMTRHRHSMYRNVSIQLPYVFSLFQTWYKMSDRERYRVAYQRSRAVVKEWEATIWAAHQRKPTKEEVQQAPEKILICYKNCKKIKHYFDNNKSPEAEKPSGPEVKEEVKNLTAVKQSGEDCAAVKPKSLSFSGLFSTASEQPTSSPLVTKATSEVQSDAKTGTCRGVWGQHLNRSAKLEDRGSNSSSQLVAKLAFSYDKTASVTSTRTSLKKRAGGLNAKSRSFFGSLGEDSSFLADLSQASFLDESQASGVVLTTGDSDTPTMIDSDSSVPATPDLSERSSLIKNVTSHAGIVIDDDDDSASMPAFTSVVSAKICAARPERSTAGVDAGWLQRCAKLDLEEPTPAAAVVAINSLAHVGSGRVGEKSPVVATKEVAKAKPPTSLLEPSLTSTPENGSKVPAATAVSATAKAEPTSFKGIFTTENLPSTKLLPGMFFCFRILKACVVDP
jgi:hypothetical protein